MRRMALALAVVLALSVGGLVGFPSAAAAETVYVPVSGSMAVTGHGYGHGHGLSQYGAQGAALRGATAAQILAFYYPGTVATTYPHSVLRVQVTANAGRPAAVSSFSGLQVRDAQTGATTALTTAYPMWRISYSTTYKYLLQYLSASTWHTLRTSVNPLGFVGGYTIRLWPTAATTVDFRNVASAGYRGEMRAVWTGSSFLTVNYVLMELYLRGVVPRESPASFPAAALQAQAVAARSYSVLKRATYVSRGFDVYDTTSDQVYGGYLRWATAASSPTYYEHPNTDKAVAATANGVRSYGGRVIFAQFSSSNGGFVASGGQPYLRAARDSWEASSTNPNKSWSTSAAVSSLRSLAGLKTLSRMVISRETSAGGHVSTVAFTGTDSANRAVTVTRTGDQVRSYFGWRSTYFSF